MTDPRYKRVPYPEHPDRCQANAKGEQCNLMKHLSSDYCYIHGGNKAEQKEKNESLKNYRLTQWRARLQRHSSSSEIKNIREEIGILRMLLEERLEQANTPTELMIQSGPIADLVLKIEKCVSSCHRLEGSMGELLDKQAILQFASEVIGIVTNVLSDEVAINSIADQILEVIGRIGE